MCTRSMTRSPIIGITRPSFKRRVFFSFFFGAGGGGGGGGGSKIINDQCGPGNSHHTRPG